MFLSYLSGINLLVPPIIAQWKGRASLLWSRMRGWETEGEGGGEKPSLPGLAHPPYQELYNSSLLWEIPVPRPGVMETQGRQWGRGTISREMPSCLPLKASWNDLLGQGPLLRALTAPWTFLYPSRPHVAFYLPIPLFLLLTGSYLRQEIDLTRGTRMSTGYGQTGR